MAQYTVTNNARGARGAGSVLVDAGQTVTVEITDDEAVLLSGFDDVEITEVDTKPAKK